MEPNYVYRAVVTRVVDGDTVDANIDLGFRLFTKDRIRLTGIDTPESRTRNKKEKALGLAAKARIKQLLTAAPLLKGKRGKKAVYLETSKDGKGKFGRILGTLWIGTTNINEQLVAEGHARKYFGGSKGEQGPWTIEENGVWLRWTADGYVNYETPLPGSPLFGVGE
jgi:micrococcal nuclease